MIKSVDRETTFEEDMTDINLIMKALDKLSREIHEEVMEHKLHFRTVTIKIRYENFETHTHGKTLSLSTNDIESLQKASRELIQTYLGKNRRVRLIGLRVSNLMSGKEQKTLF